MCPTIRPPTPKWHDLERPDPHPWRYLQAVDALTRQVDASAWPLVVLRPFQFGNELSLEALDQGLGSILERGERFCMLADFTQKTYIELPEVRHLTEMFRHHGQRLDDGLVALGLAVPSAMVRGAVKLILQARPPNFPYEVLRTRREARRYIAAHLEQHARSAPPEDHDADSGISVAVGH